MARDLQTDCPGCGCLEHSGFCDFCGCLDSRPPEEKHCARCKGSGIDPVYSLPAEGPSYYSMGEPDVLEPCIACQYPPFPCRGCGTLWSYDQPACINPECVTHTHTCNNCEGIDTQTCLFLLTPLTRPGE